MTYDQKQKIEEAIYRLKSEVGKFFTIRTDEQQEKVLVAQNALYDAIGGMDDYKFDLN